MPKVLSCVNLKGGVGKTALAVNLAAYCGQKGYRALLIDLDPQTNATLSAISYDHWRQHAQENGTIADLLGARKFGAAEAKDAHASDVVVRSVFNGVDLIPSHLDLFTIDLDLANATARETLLRRNIRDILDQYDIVICDCPPNLTIPTQNAIALSDYYVVPISPDYLSALGVGLLENRIKEFCEDLEDDAEGIGIVISRVGRRSDHREKIIRTLRQQFEDRVLDAVLTERSVVSECAERNSTVFSSTNSDAIQEFSSVCEEILSRMEMIDENP